MRLRFRRQLSATRQGLTLAFLSAVLLAGPIASAAHEYDEANARDIMQLCAGCHGDFGQGGSDGEYPRLAGMSAEYLAGQMRSFRDGTRPSIEMAPFASAKELSDDDLLDITRFLSEIELLTRMPVIDPDLDSYEKLLIAGRVFNVPRLPGDQARGQTVYERSCLDCHGEAGAGVDEVPRLAGQYSDYLRAQIEAFRSGRRPNEAMLDVLPLLTPADIDALLAYLSVADD